MVYFITDGEYMKIGTTEDVVKRLKGIQTGNPKLLSVGLIIPGNSTEERKWHRKFRKYQTEAKNEWFLIDKETLNIALNNRFTKEQLLNLEEYTIRTVGVKKFTKIIEIKIKARITKKIHNELIVNYINDCLLNKKNYPITYNNLCDRFSISLDDMKIFLKKDNLLNKIMIHNKHWKEEYKYQSKNDK